jgi:hypothetical protein
MEELSFEDWVSRHRLYRNKDCEVCPNIPNIKTCNMDSVQCPRLKRLLNQWRKIKLAEMKRQLVTKGIEPRYTLSSDFDGTDRGHKVGGLTEKHLIEGA